MNPQGRKKRENLNIKLNTIKKRCLTMAIYTPLSIA